jgi:hypothetical protein
MRRLLLPLAAAAALALPAGALAWGGDHHRYFHGMFAAVSGTGTSFGGATASATGSIVAGNDHPNGHFNAAFTTTWGSSQSKTFTDNDGDNDDGTTTVSCAPSSVTLTLTNGTTSTATLSGKTCSTTRNGTTKYRFFGASTTGVHAFLREDGTTVKGLVASGFTSGESFHLGFSLHLGDHH